MNPQRVHPPAAPNPPAMAMLPPPLNVWHGVAPHLEQMPPMPPPMAVPPPIPQYQAPFHPPMHAQMANVHGLAGQAMQPAAPPLLPQQIFGGPPGRIPADPIQAAFLLEMLQLFVPHLSHLMVFVYDSNIIPDDLVDVLSGEAPRLRKLIFGCSKIARLFYTRISRRGL
ncbi:unnamed protein product [Somion occarium]|uniref:Uncharacterized protein n=1 Tax=Somion occarium TaxID=3059160 RepID=A0ABP1CU11_9APHY